MPSSVRVLDSSTGQPIPYADVYIYAPGNEPLGNGKTGTNGIVTINQAIPEGSEWEIRHEHYFNQRIEAVNGQSVDAMLDRANPVEPITGNYDASSVIPDTASNKSDIAPAPSNGLFGIPLPVILGAGALLLAGSAAKKKNAEADMARIEENPFDPDYCE